MPATQTEEHPAVMQSGDGAPPAAPQRPPQPPPPAVPPAAVPTWQTAPAGETPPSAGGDGYIPPQQPLNVKLDVPTRPIQVSIVAAQPAGGKARDGEIADEVEMSFGDELDPEEAGLSPVESTENGAVDLVDAKSPIGLLDKLEELSEHLPEDARKEFDDHDLLLRMESLKSRLKGSRGLHSIVKHREKTSKTVSLTAVSSVFSYLKGMVSLHPNRRIGLALTTKITHIVDTIRRRTHG